MNKEIRATYDEELKQYWVATYMDGKYIPCGRFCDREEVEEMGAKVQE